MEQATQKRKPAGDGYPTAGQRTNNTQAAIVPGCTAQGKDKLALVNAAPRLSPRQARVLDALRPGHWVDREPLDRIAGSSNSPDVVWKLRHKFGQDAIDMELVDGTDRDGKPCRTGRYRLTEQGRTRLIQLGMSTGAEGRAA